MSDGQYTPGTPPVPIEQASGWAPELVFKTLDMRKYLALLGIEHDLTFVQPVNPVTVPNYSGLFLMSHWLEIQRYYLEQI